MAWKGKEQELVDAKAKRKFAEEALYKCIMYGLAAAKSNIPEYQVNRIKKERRAAIRNAKLRLAQLSPEEIIQTLRGKSKQIKH